MPYHHIILHGMLINVYETSTRNDIIGNMARIGSTISWHGSVYSRYNNWLIAKLINIFAIVEERKEESEKSLALKQTPSWARSRMRMADHTFNECEES